MRCGRSARAGSGQAMASPAVTQIDLNPVRVTTDGLEVLDALVVCD